MLIRSSALLFAGNGITKVLWYVVSVLDGSICGYDVVVGGVLNGSICGYDVVVGVFDRFICGYDVMVGVLDGSICV